MDKTQASTETQGAKVYRVNHFIIQDLSWNKRQALCQMLGFDADPATDGFSSLEGTCSQGYSYEAYFEPDRITVESGEYPSEYDVDTDAFELAIAYGIYKEVLTDG